MPQLGSRDLRGLETFLRRLYQCRREERFAPLAIDGLHKLVGARQTTWNLVGPNGVQVMATPEEQQHELREAALSDLLSQHPLFRHRVVTGDLSAHKISDFLTPAEYHRSLLYRRLYRPLEYEDLLVTFLSDAVGGSRELAVAIGRDKPDFTERERMLCNLLRPHLVAAYRHAAALSRLYRRMEWQSLKGGEPLCAELRLDARRRIVHATARASRWVRDFFGPGRTAGSLPEPLDAWQRTAAPRLVEARRHDTRLSIRADRDPLTGETRLLLEKQRLQGGSAACLTSREREVLLGVERGLRNDEIARELGVAVATVKKHLEHVFDKLEVTNRVSAVRRWRGAK